ncbi:hypothetical protein [Rufibacter sp. XAAS-G3-1]|uniref:hypothetical protein n=1 Tax=Rufibacter sp. XAAS-G3-1 TaxID=2729134 RepID=UPI0015E792D7|nr:hypothetical protein [Rufibacter sp. XAAS-G3-1]
MRKVLAVIILVTLGPVTGWSQFLSDPLLPSSGARPKPMPRLAVVTTGSHEPLLLLGSQKTDFASMVVDPKEIKVVKAYKDSAILANMGYEARHGVLLIELKSKKPLLNLEHVLDYFEVPPTQRQLRVLLNRQPVNESRFLADVKRIVKIEVITLDKISPYRISWDENEQFLNIVTVQPPSQNSKP